MLLLMSMTSAGYMIILTLFNSSKEDKCLFWINGVNQAGKIPKSYCYISGGLIRPCHPSLELSVLWLALMKEEDWIYFSACLVVIFCSVYFHQNGHFGVLKILLACKQTFGWNVNEEDTVNHECAINYSRRSLLKINLYLIISIYHFKASLKEMHNINKDIHSQRFTEKENITLKPAQQVHTKI